MGHLQNLLKKRTENPVDNEKFVPEDEVAIVQAYFAALGFRATRPKTEPETPPQGFVDRMNRMIDKVLVAPMPPEFADALAVVGIEPTVHNGVQGVQVTFPELNAYGHGDIIDKLIWESGVKYTEMPPRSTGSITYYNPCYFFSSAQITQMAGWLTELAAPARTAAISL